MPIESDRIRLKGEPLLNSFRNAFAWFVEGLVDVLDEINGLRGPRAPLRLVAEGGAVPQDGAAKFAGRDVDIVRPSAELIVRALDPLPADSRPYLDGIVRHHVERLVPWRADDVLYSYRVAEAGPRDDRLMVTIAATSRAFQASLIGALNALGVGRLRLLFPDVSGPGDDVVIPINADTLTAARRARFRRVVIAGLSLLLLAGVGGAAFLGYAWNRASETLAAAEQSIAGLRKQLAARGPQHPGQGRDLDAILTRRRTTPYAVLAIDDIAAALPDTTWLTELRIGDGHLRVSGVSRNVAELVPLIEAVPSFGEARFYAPTTRLASGGDRFYLDMRLMPGRDKTP